MSDTSWLQGSRNISRKFQTPESKGDVHRLLDIMIIALLAVLAEAERWESIGIYGQGKQDREITFLKLPNGIPSHDTFRRVLAQLEPKQLEQSFRDWGATVVDRLGANVVAIDGKTVRGSYDRGKKLKALQLVSAWSSEHRLVLGQNPVDGKSNEITAIPELLEQLNLKGTIIPIDAMGTQTAIAQKIRQAEADYILTIKGNQGRLSQTAESWFERFENQELDSEVLVYEFSQTESGHHRVETPTNWVFRAEEVLGASQCRQWSGLKSLVVVRSQRRLWNRTTNETRFFLSSLETDATSFAAWICSHCNVENPLHWCLDVVFAEDASPRRSDNAAHNFSLLRRLALNLLRQHPGKGSLKMKRYRAGLDNSFLVEILSHAFPDSQNMALNFDAFTLHIDDLGK